MLKDQSFLKICEHAWYMCKVGAPEWAHNGRRIIYVTTAVQARALANHLSNLKNRLRVPAVAYCTKGMSLEERLKAKLAWLAHDDPAQAPILVATSKSVAASTHCSRMC